MEEMKKLNQEEMNQRSETIENLVKQFEAVQANYREELRKQNEDFNEKMRKISDKLDILMRPRITELFNGNHNGLISILGNDVTITSEKNDSSNIKTSNLRKYDNSAFDNTYGATPKSETDTIIKFDFGPHKRIDLQSYFIRTNGNGQNGYHPKTWRIEGSNDSQSWTKIDSRSNDESLNGSYKECNFVCQHGNYGNVNNLYRYMRYISQECWCSDSKLNYYAIISYFELYGSVVTI